MPDDPCQNERENYYLAVGAAMAALAAAVAAAPETLGASIVVGIMAGGSGGATIGVMHNQYARCLRAHNLTAQADALDATATQIESELASIQSTANAVA